MAKSDAVWGIDIGQCALKAIRCAPSEDEDGAIVADAFDYIEYPKILSQPDAEPEELIREALEQFLSRNETRGDKVAISVAGQAGLSRFFKPPPVDAKTIPDIVKYEARQQIPFALEDVIWDFQLMGGTEVDGFTMDAEIGLFAMKRDAVYRALQPFTDADIEVDIVQLSPLAVYNLILHEVLTDLPDPEEIDPENPPESLIVMSMGTETTDLVVTNGTKLWQRSIPIGGNHFTKQLTKELKLTYAKAEHLKRNARQAEDPKTVFQVMRPVFNDLVTEIQRSITYFQSIDRQAKIGRMVMLGNGVKLPGLRQYLSKNLGHEVVKIDSLKSLKGSTVVASKSFKENVLSFGVCYGLCLQGLGEGSLKTNLLPQEFVTERLIREKKPWALAAVGALLLAFTFNFFFYYNAWYKTHPERPVGPQGLTWDGTAKEVTRVSGISSAHMTKDKEKTAELAWLRGVGDEVVGAGDRMRLWLELCKVIDMSVPVPNPAFGYERGESPDPEIVPFAERLEFQIEYIESQYFADVANWFNDEIKKEHADQERIFAEQAARAARGAPETEPSEEEDGGEESFDAPADSGTEEAEDPGPSGEGWIIEIKFHHFYNESPTVGGRMHVLNTLIKNLKEKTYDLDGCAGEPFTLEELGISYPVIAENTPVPSYQIKLKVTSEVEDEDGEPGTMKTVTEEKVYDARRHDFVVQFVWQPKRLAERIDAREEKKKKELAQQDAEKNNGGPDVPVGDGGGL